MKRRHPLPTRWLMTDERLGDALWPAILRLPRGGGIVFRHHATPAPLRHRLYLRVRALARKRGLILVLAGPPRLAIAWRADGAHGRSPHIVTPRRLIRTAPAHDAREIAAARAADLLFLSPVFPTQSHAGQPALGPLRFAALARLAGQPVVALGGMNAIRMKRIMAYGWAAIDAWSEANRADL